MASMVRSLTMSSASSSGFCSRLRPNSAASAWPTGDEIVAGVEPGRDLADLVAQRLAVAQHHRARQHVDLHAGVVDVVFLGDLVAGEGKQVGERIADHRAAAMADMHRAGRVGRDIFDIDLAAAADRRAAVIRAGIEDGGKLGMPVAIADPRLTKPGPGHFGRGDIRVGPQRFGDLLGQRSRVLAGRLGQHHRGIGREIAMRGVARRLDADPRQIRTQRRPCL